jgi:hypothetical protein
MSSHARPGEPQPSPAQKLGIFCRYVDPDNGTECGQLNEIVISPEFRPGASWYCGLCGDDLGVFLIPDEVLSAEHLVEYPHAIPVEARFTY